MSVDLAPATAFATQYGQPLAMGVGAVGAILALVLLIRFARTGRAHDRLGTLAVLLATGFAMEGMWEVARTRLGLGAVAALVFCGTFEILAAWLGALSRHLLREDRTADVRPYMRWLWAVSAASGVIASSAGDNVTEVLLRLVSPAGAAVVWWIGLRVLAGHQTRARQESAWIWTPQRIGVRLGLLKPGSADDLTDVFRARRVARMARLAERLDTSRGWRARRAARRLRRLATGADADLIAEVATRYRRGVDAQQAILGEVRVEVGGAPATRPDAGSTQAGDAEPPVQADAPETRPADAPTDAPASPPPPAMTQLLTHPDAPRRTRAVVMRRPVSAPPDTRTDADRDAAIAAALDAVLTRGVAMRQAARDAAVSEATIRRRVAEARAAQGEPRVNGSRTDLVDTTA